MLLTSLLLSTSLPLAALAGNQHLGSARSQQLRRHAQHTHLGRRNNGGSGFTLTDMYKGKNFFDGWDFFTQPDPTHGNVNFVSSDDAFKLGLAYVQDDNTVVMKVDNTSTLGLGQNRNSVRITTKKQYNGGLFLADIFAMPHGCSVWPAWWMTGPDWPKSGELDVLEGVHEGPVNQITMHTSSGCNLNPNPPASKIRGGSKNATTGGTAQAFTAKVLSTTCESSGSNNNGCAFQDQASNSYGHNFNLNAGGVFAHLWDTTDGMSVWFFPRGSIPQDITSGQPDPSGWGTPVAFWDNDQCKLNDHFKDNSLIFDITLCGDWAGATYQSAGCPGTCQQAVTDPRNFDLAQWKINYVAAYN